MSSRNDCQAARTFGIHDKTRISVGDSAANTLLKWMREPEFQATYREARRAAFSQSIARMQQASRAAVTTR
jgi:hypothetical protein